MSFKSWMSCIVHVDKKIDSIQVSVSEKIDLSEYRRMERSMEEMRRRLEKTDAVVERLNNTVDSLVQINNRLSESCNELEMKYRSLADGNKTAHSFSQDLIFVPEENNQQKDSAVPETEVKFSEKMPKKKLLASEFSISRPEKATGCDWHISDAQQYIAMVCDMSGIVEALEYCGDDGAICLKIIRRLEGQLKRSIVVDNTEDEELAEMLISKVIAEMKYQFFDKFIGRVVSRNRLSPSVWSPVVSAVCRYLEKLGFYTKPIYEGCCIDDESLDYFPTAEKVSDRELNGRIKSVERPAFYIDYSLYGERMTASISGSCTVFCFNSEDI